MLDGKRDAARNQRRQLSLIAHQKHGKAGTHSVHGACDKSAWCVIPSHCIQGDHPGLRGERISQVLLRGRLDSSLSDDLHTAVDTAARADAVEELQLAAVLTVLRGSSDVEGIVGTTHALASLGSALLGNSHGYTGEESMKEIGAAERLLVGKLEA